MEVVSSLPPHVLALDDDPSIRSLITDYLGEPLSPLHSAITIGHEDDELLGVFCGNGGTLADDDCSVFFCHNEYDLSFQ